MSLEPGAFVERWLPGWAASRGLVVRRAPYRQAHVGDQYREVELFGGPGDDLDGLFAAVAGDPRAMLTLVGLEPVPPPPPVRLTADDESAMTTDLTPLPTVAHGLTVREEAGTDRQIVALYDGDRRAATGQIGLRGADVIFDKIETDPEYRRRGLARAVMALLTDRALERGGTTGLLIASAEGRLLYERLGWQVCGPVATYLGA